MTARWLGTCVVFCSALLFAGTIRADDNSADTAIASALAYLANQQNADGSFAADDHPVESTALSLLAFLSTGNTQDGGRYAGTVRRAVDFLLHQAPTDHDWGKIDGS